MTLLFRIETKVNKSRMRSPVNGKDSFFSLKKFFQKLFVIKKSFVHLQSQNARFRGKVLSIFVNYQHSNI